MKLYVPLFLNLLCFILPSCLLAQGNIQLKISLDNIDSKEIQIVPALEGKYFYGAKIDTLIGTDNILDLSFADSKWGTYTVIYGWKAYYLFLFPGDTIHLTFSKSKDDKIVASFDGDNAAGHKRYTTFYRPFYQGLGEGYLQKYETPENSREAIFRQMAKEWSIIDSLNNRNEITDEYAALSKVSIETYYRSVAAYTLFNALRDLNLRNDSLQLDVDRISTYVSSWKEILADYDFTSETNVRSEHFNEWLQARNSLLSSQIDIHSGAVMPPLPSTTSYGESLYRINHSFTADAEHKEYILANALLNGTIQKKYESILIDFFDDFNRTYPHSPYARYIKPHVDEIIAYHEIVKGDFTDKMKFVENYASFEDFDDVKEYFKDKTVYVDIWATWCGPCKEEFAYNDGLKAYARDKGIDVLYLSVDRDNADEQWKEMIKYYNLEGYHIRTTPTLHKQVSELFSKDFNGQRGFGIPHYVIIKNGEIVVQDALRPSSKEQLYRQLDSFL